MPATENRFSSSAFAFLEFWNKFKLNRNTYALKFYPQTQTKFQLMLRMWRRNFSQFRSHLPRHSTSGNCFGTQINFENLFWNADQLREPVLELRSTLRTCFGTQINFDLPKIVWARRYTIVGKRPPPTAVFKIQLSSKYLITRSWHLWDSAKSSGGILRYSGKDPASRNVFSHNQPLICWTKAKNLAAYLVNAKHC